MAQSKTPASEKVVRLRSVKGAGVSKSITGVVKFNRSKSSDCVCCDGPHIYGRDIKIKKRPSIFQGLKVKSVEDWLHEQLFLIEGIENKKVRITIEIVEAPVELAEVKRA